MIYQKDLQMTQELLQSLKAEGLGITEDESLILVGMLDLKTLKIMLKIHLQKQCLKQQKSYKILHNLNNG